MRHSRIYKTSSFSKRTSDHTPEVSKPEVSKVSPFSKRTSHQIPQKSAKCPHSQRENLTRHFRSKQSVPFFQREHLIGHSRSQQSVPVFKESISSDTPEVSKVSPFSKRTSHQTLQMSAKCLILKEIITSDTPEVIKLSPFSKRIFHQTLQK